MIIGGLLTAVVAAGCSGGDSDSPGAPTGGDQGQLTDGGLAESSTAEEPAADAGLDEQDAITAASLTTRRQQIMTAGLVVETDDVRSAAHQVETIAIGAGGFVTDEDTQVQRADIPSTDGQAAGGAEDLVVSSLTVKVPPASLDDVLGTLAALGELVSQTRSTTDVTDEYVDVQARLTSQQASLDRLLLLVGEAGALDDVIALENEIARRQADLDGLSARLQAIDDDVALATVAITLTSSGGAVQVQRDDTGFLAGLRSGWDAFAAAAVGGLTVLGAVLPFAAVVALVGVAVLAVRRRRRPAAAAPPLDVA